MCGLMPPWLHLSTESLRVPARVDVYSHTNASMLIHAHTHTHTHTHTVKGYIRKGHALLGIRDTVKAMSAFQHALDLDPNNAVSVLVFDHVTSYMECACHVTVT